MDIIDETLEKPNPLPETELNLEVKSGANTPSANLNVFDEDPNHDIHYRTLSWQFVALLMIAEIVSNGMLSLPSALAVVGIVPGVILIVFLGVFGLYTAKLLIDFKLNHPSVHSMGDAGFILGGPIAREVLSLGTIIFAIAGTGSELLSGQQALSTLSNNGICAIYIQIIFASATFVVALPRTLGRLGWLGLVSVLVITAAGIVAMVGAGLNPVPGHSNNATIAVDFNQAFVAITNPVRYSPSQVIALPICVLLLLMTLHGLAPSGHFMFFILISEMRRPEDAMKAAWCLQGFATIFYTLFAVIMYMYVGNDIASPAFFSLPAPWAKAAFGISLLNFLVAGSLYSHTAAKLVFVRIFRHSRHVYKHTILGWIVWTTLCFAAVVVAFIFAIAVPIFSYLIGIAASLFASWYTYGLAGFFWLHDVYHLQGGRRGFLRHPVQFSFAIMTIAAGGFICITGIYVTIKLIDDAYKDGLIGKPFSC